MTLGVCAGGFDVVSKPRRFRRAANVQQQRIRRSRPALCHMTHPFKKEPVVVTLVRQRPQSEQKKQFEGL